MTAWQTRAACATVDPELFFSQADEQGRTKADRARIRAAKKVCACCPVREPCAEALWTDKHAIAGGLTPDERKTASN